jgi:MFS family permease
MMPTYRLFGLALVVIGISAQTFTTSTNSLVQLSTEPGMRGRVIAILLAIALGTTPLGAPVVGWVADTFGPRWALGVGAASGFLAALVGINYLYKYCHLQISLTGGKISVAFDRWSFHGETEVRLAPANDVSAMADPAMKLRDSDSVVGRPYV